MIRLRPYKEKDTETILSWVKDEKSFYRWTAGILGEYPLTVEQFQKVNDLMNYELVLSLWILKNVVRVMGKTCCCLQSNMPTRYMAQTRYR